MPKSNLPVYAIVELLIRLAPYNNFIGNYKDHNLNGDDIKVKTTGGTICFTRVLIMRQFENPELITDAELIDIATAFNPTA
jgi:hypothetical protein